MLTKLLLTLRLLACLGALGLAPQPAAAGLHAPSAFAAAPAVEQKKDEKSCRQGVRTKTFGWMLVDYGLQTAKYVVGLFLIPVGLLLVCVGAVVEVVEAVAC